MGWGNCGKDSEGRPIGYCHEATCDHPGCNVEIDRGLAYACGGMHGSDTLPSSDLTVCEKYFCGKHLFVVETKDGDCFAVCEKCKADNAAELKNDEEPEDEE